MKYLLVFVVILSAGGLLATNSDFQFGDQAKNETIKIPKFSITPIIPTINDRFRLHVPPPPQFQSNLHIVADKIIATLHNNIKQEQKVEKEETTTKYVCVENNLFES